MAIHLPWFLLFFLLSHVRTSPATSLNSTFSFNGFQPSDLSLLSGFATVISTGALQLTNGQRTMNLPGITGQAFYPAILQFKKGPSATTTRSFSTHFVFEIVSKDQKPGGHGFAFVLAPSTNFCSASGGPFLGFVNQSNNVNPNSHIFAVEFDTVQQVDLEDRDGNHVGIDVNGVISNTSESAAYYTELNKKETVLLDSQTPIQAWIEYDGKGKQLNVTIAPLSHPLAHIIFQALYLGLELHDGRKSTRVGPLTPSFCSRDRTPLGKSLKLYLYLSVALVIILFLIITISICYWTHKKRKLTSEKVEEWEMDYPHRFPYRELYRATKGFKEELGKGGFGSVYKGVLPRSGMEVAVKKVSHSSKQGIREFVAEVSSLGRMRHRNLVQLQGWCRRGEELLLAYEFMPKGSLDSHIFGIRRKSLSWEQRFKIVKGIASGLLYLHEEWEQVVVHRDVKASNVLLDGDLNGRLGDFGLSRLYEHGTKPKTTKIVGSFGYMAPELSRTCKFTTSSDVYSYGALLLEMACGRRPIEPERPCDEMVLVELVHSLWKGGRILDAMDNKLGNSYVVEEAELVLKLGVLCSQAAPESRPNMRQLTQFLNGGASLQDLECHNIVIQDDPGMDQLILQYSSSAILSSTSGNSGS
ncbi:L-type lectin-domain containing receptor kinase SIT2-like [Nymphaea colorata]|nr:L-type lectin-domain containing receptor kinase SIT2-like [Nymphaea colorata]